MRHSSSSSRRVERRRLGAGRRRPCWRHLALQVEGDLAEDRLLGVEVAVEGAVGGAGPLGDVGHVGGEELLLGEHLRPPPRRARPGSADRAGSSASPTVSVMADHAWPGMRPWRWSVHEIACSRSQHGSSTRPSWVTGVRSTAMPASWQAASTASSTATSSRRRAAPDVAEAGGQRGVVLGWLGDDHRTRRRRSAAARSEARSSAAVSGAGAHDDRADRPVAQHVALAAQPAAVDRPAELLGPRIGGTTPRRRRASAHRRCGGT